MLAFVVRLPAPSKATPSAPSIAEVYLRTAGGDFPCKGWDDRVLSILPAWLSNASGLLNVSQPLKQTTQVFETGPYQFTVTVGQEGIATLHFVRTYIPDPIDIVAPMDIELRRYCQVLLDASRALRDQCRDTGFGSAVEHRDLDRNIQRLESALAR